MSGGTLPSALPSFLWRFIGRRKWLFLFLLLSPCAHVLESNVQPYVLKVIIDRIMAGFSPSQAYGVLMPPVMVFLVTLALMLVIFRIQEKISTWWFPQFRADVRMNLFAYTQSHSHAYFSEYFAGSIANKIADLPRSASALIELVRWRLVMAASVALVAILSLAVVSPAFSAVMAVWVLVHMAISYTFARKVNEYSSVHAEDLSALQGHIVDSITNISAVRLFARRAFEALYIGKWQKTEQESDRKTAMTMWRARFCMDILLMATYIATFALLLEGWKAEWLGAGDMVFILQSMFNVMALTWQLGSELPNFFREIGVCNQALTLITKSHGIADANGARALIVARGEIMFDKVHFNYIPGKDIFRNKSIHIRPGEKIGLVGFSGSGKSTFVNLILRLYDVDGGKIRIDGQNIAEVTQDSLRSAIAMIPQDSSLFHRTLMENIRYGRIEATDEEVMEASRLAHCHEFIEQLEEGYHALVGERGIKLSGGQRQRIAIARAALKNAPILILDEATSALDSITERYIQESLDRLMQGRTTIVIAHRLSTLAHMDRILVFRQGEIIEDGSHQELLALGGHYASLWNMQAGGFLPEGKGS